MTKTFLSTLSLLALSSTLSAQFLVCIDSSRAISTIDSATGTKTLLTTASSNASTTAGFAYDAATRTMYLTSTGNDSLYSLDLATGTATLIGAYGNSALVMHGLEYHTPSGQLYGASSHDGGLYAIDKLTGAATLIGLTGLTSFTNLAWDSAAGVMYATNSGNDSFYSVDLTTGLATLIGPLTGPTNPNGLAFDTDAGVLYMVDNSTDTLYTIDRSTGAATAIGSTGSGNLLGLAYLPARQGSTRTLAHACGPTTISAVGLPRLGHTINISLGGLTGTPVLGIGLNITALPFCTCTIGHDWLVTVFGAALPLAIPATPSITGAQVGVQGLDFLGTGGCPSPTLTLTDTIVFTIG